MKIGFFEIEDWAVEKIKKNFPGAFISQEHLDEKTVVLHTDLEVIASFIYSDLTARVLSKLSKLKMIATMSTGFDHIDLDYCKERGVIVSNVPVYGERTVAEHTFGLILTLTRRLYESIDRTKRGNFSLMGLRGTDLCEKTLGIIGMGNIGQEVVKIARGFQMKVVVHTRSQEQKMADALGYTYVTLDELLKKSDVVSLHLPLNDSTHHMINKENILKMKKGSYLINTSRGGLIEDEAILLGLQKGILGGVGLDVLEQEIALKEEMQLLSTAFRQSINYEKLVYDHVILHHPRVVVTPHNAFNSEEALGRILTTTCENIESFTQGNPQNVV